MAKTFKHINSPLEKILNQYKLGNVFNLDRIKKNWKSFDKTLSIHAEPVNFYNKKLSIRVKNTVWKKEFTENKHLLIVKLKNAFSDIEIKEIEII